MKKLSFLIIFLFSLPVFGQNLEPFRIFNKKGKKVSTASFLKGLEKSDVVLFGEYHNNPIAHWLQLKVAQHLYSKNPISMGAEMLEADQQEILNRYLAGEINQKEVDSLTSLWVNYKTDYKPLVDFAKEENLTFVATNVPRRYASILFRNGLDYLLENVTEEDKQWIAPLPFPYDQELPAYKEMLTMMGHTPNPNFPLAQAIKDATMAYFIVQQIKRDGKQFLHFNGAYHSNNYEGIYWYLNQYQSGLKIVTISTVEQTNVKKLDPENKGIADFIIVVDEQMTKTH